MDPDDLALWDTTYSQCIVCDGRVFQRAHIEPFGGVDQEPWLKTFRNRQLVDPRTKLTSYCNIIPIATPYHDHSFDANCWTIYPEKKLLLRIARNEMWDLRRRLTALSDGLGELPRQTWEKGYGQEKLQNSFRFFWMDMEGNLFPKSIPLGDTYRAYHDHQRCILIASPTIVISARTLALEKHYDREPLNTELRESYDIGNYIKDMWGQSLTLHKEAEKLLDAGRPFSVPELDSDPDWRLPDVPGPSFCDHRPNPDDHDLGPDPESEPNHKDDHLDKDHPPPQSSTSEKSSRRLRSHASQDAGPSGTRHMAHGTADYSSFPITTHNLHRFDRSSRRRSTTSSMQSWTDGLRPKEYLPLLTPPASNKGVSDTLKDAETTVEEVENAGLVEMIKTGRKIENVGIVKDTEKVVRISWINKGITQCIQWWSGWVL